MGLGVASRRSYSQLASLERQWDPFPVNGLEMYGEMEILNPTRRLGPLSISYLAGAAQWCGGVAADHNDCSQFSTQPQLTTT